MPACSPALTSGSVPSRIWLLHRKELGNAPQSNEHLLSTNSPTDRTGPTPGGGPPPAEGAPAARRVAGGPPIAVDRDRHQRRRPRAGNAAAGDRLGEKRRYDSVQPVAERSSDHPHERRAGDQQEPEHPGPGREQSE